MKIAQHLAPARVDSGRPLSRKHYARRLHKAVTHQATLSRRCIKMDTPLRTSRAGIYRLDDDVRDRRFFGAILSVVSCVYLSNSPDRPLGYTVWAKGTKP